MTAVRVRHVLIAAIAIGSAAVADERSSAAGSAAAVPRETTPATAGGRLEWLVLGRFQDTAAAKVRSKEWRNFSLGWELHNAVRFPEGYPRVEARTGAEGAREEWVIAGVCEPLAGERVATVFRPFFKDLERVTAPADSTAACPILYGSLALRTVRSVESSGKRIVAALLFREPVDQDLRVPRSELRRADASVLAVVVALYGSQGLYTDDWLQYKSLTDVIDEPTRCKVDLDAEGARIVIQAWCKKEMERCSDDDWIEFEDRHSVGVGDLRFDWQTKSLKLLKAKRCTPP